MAAKKLPMNQKPSSTNFWMSLTSFRTSTSYAIVCRQDKRSTSDGLHRLSDQVSDRSAQSDRKQDGQLQGRGTGKEGEKKKKELKAKKEKEKDAAGGKQGEGGSESKESRDDKKSEETTDKKK